MMMRFPALGPPYTTPHPLQFLVESPLGVNGLRLCPELPSLSVKSMFGSDTFFPFLPTPIPPPPLSTHRPHPFFSLHPPHPSPPDSHFLLPLLPPLTTDPPPNTLLPTPSSTPQPPSSPPPPRPFTLYPRLPPPLSLSQPCYPSLHYSPPPPPPASPPLSPSLLLRPTCLNPLLPPYSSPCPLSLLLLAPFPPPPPLFSHSPFLLLPSSPHPPSYSPSSLHPPSFLSTLSSSLFPVSSLHNTFPLSSSFPLNSPPKPPSHLFLLSPFSVWNLPRKTYPLPHYFSWRLLEPFPPPANFFDSKYIEGTITSALLRPRFLPPFS